MTEHVQRRAARDRNDDLPEPTILDQARTGSPEALAQLFREHLPVGIARAQQLVRNSDLAEEIATETFVRVFEAMSRGFGPQTSFRGYYLAAVQNVAFERARSKAFRSEMSTDQIDVYARPVYDVDISERSDRVWTALGSLPERWGDVLRLSAIEGRTPQQLGSALGLDPRAAAALTYRARKAFRVAYLSLDVERQPASV